MMTDIRTKLGETIHIMQFNTILSHLHIEAMLSQYGITITF